MDQSTGGSPEPDDAAARPGEWAADDDWRFDHDLPGSHPGDRPHRFLVSFPMPAAPPPPPRRRGAWWVGVLAGVVGALLTLGALALFGVLDREQEPEPLAEPEPPATVVQVREIVTEGDGGTSAAAVGRKVTPSIVTVQVGTEGTDGGFDEFGLGSGVVFGADGLIVTNHHVIESATFTRVVFQDGATYTAEVVGSDDSTDLAVLRIAAADLVPIELGATDGLSIGDVAIAVGNPLGLPGGASLTVGVLSAFEREVNTGTPVTLFGMLQTDAPITQGSSGGALVDGSGRLIGITTAIGVSSAGAEGIGFAIPVEVVQRVANEIASSGTVRHAFLGVELDDHIVDRRDGGQIPAGAAVTRVLTEDDSAAAAAGIRSGDIIVGLEGALIDTPADLISGLRRHSVGDTVGISVLRNGEAIEFEVVLGARPEDL